MADSNGLAAKSIKVSSVIDLGRALELLIFN